MGLCFAMGLAMLQALYRWMKGLTLKKEPGGAMLDEHLWAHVLQHLDTLQDHVRAATSCRAAWKSGQSAFRMRYLKHDLQLAVIHVMDFRMQCVST